MATSKIERQEAWRTELLTETNGSIFQNRITNAQLFIKKFAIGNMGKIVFVYCMFKAAQDIGAGWAIITGFPISYGASKVELSGNVSGANSGFYIDNTGTIFTRQAIANGAWGECSGVYVSSS